MIGTLHYETAVEDRAPNVHEVEFADDNGRTCAMVALKAEQLMRLHHESAKPLSGVPVPIARCPASPAETPTRRAS
jgi:Domain of unknown function (DUF4926)